MRYILILFFAVLSFNSFARQNVDSLTYALQRNKINDMLEARRNKFGQFDVSLNSRTGIFGLKTKKDMQRSMDILREIVQTDNNIFVETKTLLDFKTFQQEQVASQSKLSEDKNLAYMRTINKLQTENERLHQESEDFKKGKKFYQLVAFALGLAIISFGLFVYRKISLK